VVSGTSCYLELIALYNPLILSFYYLY